MATVIDQMDVQVTDAAQEPPRPSGSTAAPHMDPEAIERVIKRAHERRERLAAD